MSAAPFRALVATTSFAVVALSATGAGATVVSEWNAAALQEVRKSKALRNGPPIVARALAIVHTCIYDAWAAYDEVAVGTVLGGGLRQPRGARTEANKAEAISFAAYRCLRNLYPEAASKVRLDAVLMNVRVNHDGVPDPAGHFPRTGIGYDPAQTSYMGTDRPAGIGNRAAQAVIDARANDGANQYGNAPCPVGNVCPTVPVTIFGAVPCVAGPPGQTVTPPLGQLGTAPLELRPLPCVGPGGAPGGPYADYDDPAAGYRSYVPRNPLMGFCNPLEPVCPQADPFIPAAAPWPNIFDIKQWQPLIFSTHSRQTFAGPYMTRVRPFALRSADQFDHLRESHPSIFRSPQHYRRAAEEVLRNSAALTPHKKLIVEYWADGPESEFPPGHWGLFAQFVSARDRHSTDQDAKMFFAMHNASFDAGMVGWHLKRKFDGVRPITAIRHLFRGQMVRAYGGPGRPTEMIPGEKWMPYNPGTNLTPPFPGFVSGHSAFSAASAEVLKRFTGSDYFGFTTVVPANFGRVEPGIPAVDTPLSYATFSEAAEAAALSRLYGGIHFAEDNESGVSLGKRVGRQAWRKARTYFNGGEPPRDRDDDDDD